MSQSPWLALQSHRHDLQNFLQLMKAYLQIGRPERALSVVDDCAEWLNSLSLLQSQVPETAEQLFWTALSCSHLRIQVEMFSATADLQALCDGLSWLEQQAVEHNSKYVVVTIQVVQGAKRDAKPDEGGSSQADDQWLVRVTGSPDEQDGLKMMFSVDGLSWQKGVQLVK